ncbi:diguanylate cyclase, partial [Vibrio parahaemolyticus]|nr:diguanylate cyclase [Vibrio parahaemolyticus]MDF4851840.1 diguanylate cyclase [Vibrio parahaemolyticus]
NANNVSSLSTSIGVAHYPSDSDNVDFLISIADKRMYKMKFQR